MEKLYTVKETAEILRVTVQTIFNYLRDGKLDAIRATGKTLISESAIQKLIDSGKK